MNYIDNHQNIAMPTPHVTGQTAHAPHVTGHSAHAPHVTVVGAGLAGTEAALQLARWGIPVKLLELRGAPQLQTPTLSASAADGPSTPASGDQVKNTAAHKTLDPAELVCSNSFGSQGDLSAPGQLKREAALFGSRVLSAAKLSEVPAGQSLSVDREQFSKILRAEIAKHSPLLTLERSEAANLSDLARPTLIATGPLTSESLSASLQQHFGSDFLYFFDAISPVVDADSIDRSIVWAQDRYDKGSPDYLNCPLNSYEYEAFLDAVIAAKKITPKHFEETPFFEGCMPIEAMLERGRETLRFGPMKPVGLRDPRTGRRPHAVVQLRQENRFGTAYNLVGFQTRMAFGAQVEVFRKIPGLARAEFLKLGTLHRNLYLHTPTCLSRNLSSGRDSKLFFAGQITGVEGYFESACMGWLAALFLWSEITQVPITPPPPTSATGALFAALFDAQRSEKFQPTNINFSLLPPLLAPLAAQYRSDKNLRKKAQLDIATHDFTNWLNDLPAPIRPGSLLPEANFAAAPIAE